MITALTSTRPVTPSTSPGRRAISTRPHLLSITIGGCFLIVSTLAVLTVTGILIVVGLGFLALIMVPALLSKTVRRTVG